MNKEFKILLVYSNAMMENLIPLNVSYLSACLKKAGFSVKLFDTTFYKTEEKSTDEMRVDNLQVRKFSYSDFNISYKITDVIGDFRQEVSSFKPDLIGLTAVETTYMRGLELLKSVSNLNIPTIVGGVHVTFSPEDVISEESVDMICIGEGEEAMTELCEHMRDDKDVTNIENLWVKKDGKIHKNSCRPLVNLDNLPFPDYSIYQKERFFRPMQGKIYRMAPIEVNRGCPYTCTYCCSASLAELFKDNGRWYRQKSLGRVIKELQYLIREYGLQYIYFISDSFLAMDPKNFRIFYDFYKTVKLPFWITTRPETITPGKVKMLEEMNCHVITIGLESGDEEFRRKMLNRNMSNDTIIKAFKMLEGSSIKVSVNNIIGFPTETREQVFRTIELNRQIKTSSTSVFMFAPYRGTKLRDIAVDKGYVTKDSISPDHCADYILNMPQLTKPEILGLLRTFPLYVKLGKEYFPKIKEAEAMDKKGNEIFKELSSSYIERFFSK